MKVTNILKDKVGVKILTLLKGKDTTKESVDHIARVIIAHMAKELLILLVEVKCKGQSKIILVAKPKLIQTCLDVNNNKQLVVPVELKVLLK